MKGYTAVTQDPDHQKGTINQRDPLMDLSYDFRRAKKYFTGRGILYQLIVLLVVFSLGYLVGRHIDATGFKSRDSIILRPSRELFTYNRTFTNPPSDVTNQAWADLFPARGGFLVHPTLAPNLSVVAVFHQLHCIDAIRYGYYKATMDPEANTTSAVHHGDPRHVRHCLDYLRQAIMCHADTNIEPVIPELGGAKGFGVGHRCRNYDELMGWIMQWE